jgi:aminoglycoside 3-N-acetyltransferase
MIPNYIHTNFFNYVLKKSNIYKKKINKNEVFKSMLNDLSVISENKIMIPTYNYDFPKTQIYNVKKDISHVGSFSEFFRKKFIDSRSEVPIFSSCSNFKYYKKKNIFNKIDLFGDNSDFSFLLKQNGNIINFEVDFAPTFIIFIERNISNNIIYRYFKEIDGRIISSKINKLVTANLFVKPRKIEISYDLKKIKNDLSKNKILKKKNFNGFDYEIYNSCDFFDFCIKKIKQDNLYFLDKKSKLKLKKKNISIKNKSIIKFYD